MKKVPLATPITLTDKERQELEQLAGSRKTEARLRERARIVLLAAMGNASRAIARVLGCELGMVSKWRVRDARDRMAGLNEAPDAARHRRMMRAIASASWPCSTSRRRPASPTGRRR